MIEFKIYVTPRYNKNVNIKIFDLVDFIKALNKFNDVFIWQIKLKFLAIFESENILLNVCIFSPKYPRFFSCVF